MISAIRDHRFALLGFAVAVAYWPGLLQGSFAPRWAVIAVGVPLCSKLDPRALTESMRWVLVFLGVLGAISLLGSPYPQAGALDLTYIVLLTLTAVAAAAFVSLDEIMTGIGYGLAFSSVLALAQYLGWHPLPEVSSPSGLFYSSEVLGEFSALVFVWALARPRWAIAAAAVVPIVLTGTRVGAFAAAVGLLFAFRPNWKLLVPLLIAVLAAALYAVGFMKFGSSMHRLTLWGATLMAFTPAGNGLGWGTAAFPFEEFVHSDALQAMTELGALGLAFVLVPIIALRNQRGNHAERGLLVAACVEVCISFPLHFPASGFLAAVAAGYCAGRVTPLRVGFSLGTGDHVARGVRGRDAGDTDAGGGERGSRALPDRPVSAGVASFRAHKARPELEAKAL